MSRSALAVSLAFFMGSSAVAHAQTAKADYTGYEAKALIPGVDGSLSAPGGPVSFSGGGYSTSVLGAFQGLSQFDVASFGRNFIPPDTMGAAGTSQLMEFVNGGVAVYDKSTGVRLAAMSDISFWNAAGQAGANGDSRVMFDKASGRWIATSFGDSVSNIQIAVSDTSNALGGWKSTSFTGIAGGTADYPTLALDGHAAYIGTNNFDSSGTFAGTTLNVIPLSSLFNGTGPTTTGRAVVDTPYSVITGGADGGFAIQGVNNSNAADTTGRIVAASLFYNDVIRYDIPNAGTPAEVKTPTQYVGVANYDGNNPGRQPNVGGALDINPNAPGDAAYWPNNDRVIDTLDPRIGSSVYEVNGRIYSVYTVTPVGGDHTYVRYDVIDAATNQLLDEGQIGDGVHDYWEGSLAVNKEGQVVIAYNRSGSDPSDGKISILARTFSTGPTGVLTQRGDELLLQTSLVDDYHNGSPDGFVASGRQRWGDYSAVSLDPTDDRSFWIFGEYALEYNDAAWGHPGGSGGSRWGTWIAKIGAGTAVPEPSTWALLVGGVSLAGVALRRRRRPAVPA